MAASDRVDRNDMAERSREGLVGGFLSAVRRRAFVPGAKSGGSPAAPSSRSAYHFTASIRSPSGFGALDARGGLGRLGGAWMTPVRPFWQMNITARAAA